MEIRCPKYDLIKKYYDKGYYSDKDIADYYNVGCLTETEFFKITGNSFPWTVNKTIEEEKEKTEDI